MINSAKRLVRNGLPTEGNRRRKKQTEEKRRKKKKEIKIDISNVNG